MMDQRRAVQIYLENKDKFSGMSESDAVGLIRRSGGLPAVTAPIEAAPPATAPGPGPFQGAAPAPAPEEAPAVMNPYEMALAAYNKQNPAVAAAAPAKGAPVDYVARARQDIANSRRAELEANAEISRTTKLDSEMQELINNRQARYDTEISNADKDRKQATWMAVAQAGMKMAQSQSPYFMQALASGMEAGINGYSEAKAKAAEKKARLQDAKEDLVIKAKELRDQAVKDAIAARLASKQAAAADTQLLKDALSTQVAGATAEDVIKSARLGNEQTQAQIANIYDTIRERGKASSRADRALATRGTSGGAGGVNLKNAGQFVNSLVSENKIYASTIADPTASRADKDKARAGMAENKRKIDYVRSLQGQKFGMGSGFKLLGPA